MKILFVCSMGRMRSKTAAHTVGGFTLEKDYGGTDADADRPITKEMVESADIIVCMEMRHRGKLRRRFNGISHKIIVWNIPDIYAYMDDTLVCIIRGKFENLLKKCPNEGARGSEGVL